MLFSVARALPVIYCKESVFFSPPPFFSKPSIQDSELDEIGNAFVTCFEAFERRGFKLRRRIFIPPFSKWLFRTYSVPRHFRVAWG